MPDYDTYIVNAFVTDSPFSGNPAGVCLMREAASEEWMQALAANLNLSETAFLHPVPSHSTETNWHIRYFTPVTEVPLCGHATLASGAVLFAAGKAAAGERIRFRTSHDLLQLEQAGDALALRLPRYPLKQVDFIDAVQNVTGLHPAAVFTTARNSNQEWIYAIYESGQQISDLRVNQALLAASSLNTLCVSAPSTEPDCDYVLRFFSPRYGITEDPVTGAAQCGLAGYWSERLGKMRLKGRQLSARGGAFSVHVDEASIRLEGRCSIIMEGVRCI